MADKPIKKFSPFDYFKELTSRNPIKDITLDSGFNSSYSPMMMNKLVGSLPMYNSLACVMDQYITSVPKEMNFEFYQNVLPKTFMRIDYIGKNAERKDFLEIRESISKFYEVGSRDAELLIESLDESEVKRIHSMMSGSFNSDAK